MDKFTFIGLWDVYGGLLTDVRKEITDMYFNLDLTVSEIAKEKGISRQAVSDCLKGCKKQLEGYEEKLHILKKLTGAAKWAESFKSAHPEFATDIKGLEDILNKDYSEEAAEPLKITENSFSG